jgi:hypothetical protein
MGEMCNALRVSARVIAVLSLAYFASLYTRIEWADVLRMNADAMLSRLRDAWANPHVEVDPPMPADRVFEGRCVDQKDSRWKA